MESMTGYSHTEGATDQFSYSISLKSLNSKYLEIYAHLPKVIKDYGEEIEAMLKSTFIRGKIELTVEVFDWMETKKVTVNYDAIKGYYDEFSRIEKKLKLAGTLDLNFLLGMDGVIQKERTLITAKTKKDIMRAIGDVVARAKRMRNGEGLSIKKDIGKSLTAISKGLGRIQTLTGDVPARAFTRLKEAIETMSSGKVSDERLLAEIAILADKLDINEEKVRLRDHINKFNEMMAEEGQIGKRLDFLAQELFREINTISSKSNSSPVAHLVVEMKNHVDKIREHCRNVV